MSNFSSIEDRVISEHEWERQKKAERVQREQDRINKARDDELARERRKEEAIIKNQLEYSDELATEICERISAGELLINICNDSHMPTVRRCNYWLKNNQDFSAIYKDAINDRLNIFEEEVIQIADDVAKDVREVVRNGKTIKQLDAEVIARAKIRIDTRFKHLKAGRPQKWGDTSTLITKSDDEFDPTRMTTEEIEKSISDIEAKARIVKAV
jgi:terminase small subunit-like protein